MKLPAYLRPKCPLLLVAGLGGLVIVVNLASAQTWAPTSAPAGPWTSVASSANGTKLVAAGVRAFCDYGCYYSPFPIYLSGDSSLSWAQSSAPSNYWSSVASSADGTKLVAAARIYNNEGGSVFTSSDSGSTWTQSNLPTNNWLAIASSSDGSRVFAACGFDASGNPGQIYTSTDFGTTWTLTSAPGNSWTAVVCSADGTKIAAADSGFGDGLIYVSTNAGASWAAASAPFNYWSALASSADGTRVVAADRGWGDGSIYFSTNSAASWIQTTAPFNYWSALASSADGTRFVALDSGSGDGLIYTSFDSAMTWNPTTAPFNHWSCVSSTADGSDYFAAAKSFPGDGLVYSWLGSLVCPDAPTADKTAIQVGQVLDLDTLPQTTTNRQWSVISRPDNSVATIADPKLPNPIFTPDLPGLYLLSLETFNAAGEICSMGTVPFWATVGRPTPPVIATPPASLALLQGMSATFTVEAATNELPTFYQWQQDNGSYLTTLTDNDTISGSTNNTLTIFNVSPENEGAYSVIVSNGAGATTSAIAYLTIVPWRPVITSQPVSQSVLPGQNRSFSVAAVGDQPFTYRWQRNGTNLNDGNGISGATNSTLFINDPTPAKAGTYTVVITNDKGSTTSTGAVLAVTSVTAPGISLERVGQPPFGYPVAGLLQASDGYLYGAGTASAGGPYGSGGIFRVSFDGNMLPIYSFGYYYYNSAGASPYGILIQGTNGLLYGTTVTAGTNGFGTIFTVNTNRVLTTLATMNYVTSGSSNLAGLLQGRDGDYYGTASQGGASGYGTVFRVTSKGALTTLHSFSGIDGSNPSATLMQGADGNIYGTTQRGGTYTTLQKGGTNAGWGTIFKLTPTGDLTSLFSFANTNGARPVSGLVQDTDGTFYGTTYSGGISNAGTVFKMTVDGTVTSLYSFRGGTNGSNPYGGLLLSSDGNLYGTTQNGGTYTVGTVFQISPAGSLVTHAHFDHYQGANPDGALIQGADGNLYGTTYDGGPYYVGGTVFRLSIDSVLQITRQPQPQVALLGDTATFSVATHGSLPVSYRWLKNSKDLPTGGNFYGANSRTLTLTNIAVSDAALYSVVVSNRYGALASSAARLQVVVSPPYVISGPGNQTVPESSTATFAVEADGDEPLSFQWQKNGTNLIDGPTISGSASPILTLAAVTPANAGSYSVIVSNFLDAVESPSATLTVVPAVSAGLGYAPLCSFSGGTNAANPYAALTQAKDGNFYGTTPNGGTKGLGTVFKLSTNGVVSLLHSFTGAQDGANPFATLIQGQDTSFYGTASQGGGVVGAGTVFRMNANGIVTPLHNFSSQNGYYNDGIYPFGGLAQGTNGLLYATTALGGYQNAGTLFSASTNGGYVNWWNFDFNAGAYPTGGLVQGRDGYFYGTTSEGGSRGYGTVFKARFVGSFSMTTLHSFNNADGANPFGTLMQAADGNFYGTTQTGGTNGGWGTVFRITATGTFTTMHSFDQHDGAYPVGGLVQGTDGNLYGTTSEAGLGGEGTVFRIATNGVLTTLLYFYGANGANPQSSLIQARDGSFYGTTEYGGPNWTGVGTGNGLVFRLTVPMFQSNLLTQAVATNGVPYSASLSTNVTSPPSDLLTFAKLSGPAWLNVAADGALYGTPAISDIGTNTFTVRFADTNGWSSTATMNIRVLPSQVITVALSVQGTNLFLSWSGRLPPYQLQMANDLVSPVWQTIAGPLTGTTLSLRLTNPAAFYRIQGE